MTMERNFIIDQAVYLLNQQNWYDLHNNYYFNQCTIIPQTGIVILIWLRIDIVSLKIEEPKEVVINFQNVSFFEISNNILKDHISQVQEIGYKQSDDNDLNWLDNESNFSKNHHIFFRFENDEFIRIYASFAAFKVA